MLTPHQGFTYNKFDKPNDWPKIDKTFDYKIENGKLLSGNEHIYLSGPVTYTKVGNPTIEDGVASGFSSSNYLSLPATLDLSQNWEIETEFTTGNDVSSEQFVFTDTTGTFPIGFGIFTDSKFIIYFLNSEANRVFYKSDTAISNTKYKIKITYSNGSLNLYINDVLKTTKESNYPSSYVNRQIIFGEGRPANKPFKGSIDLNNTYIKVNDRLWFYGKNYTTKNMVPVLEGLEYNNTTTPSIGWVNVNTNSTTFQQFTAAPEGTMISKDETEMLQVETYQDKGTVDYTVVGNPTISSKVLTDCSSSNYLQLEQTFATSSYNSWEVVIKVKRDNNTNIRGIFCIGTSSYSLGLMFGRTDSGYLFKIKSYYGSTTRLDLETGIASDVQYNTYYYVKIRKNNNIYYLSYSLDGQTFINEVSAESDGDIPSGIPILGRYVFGGYSLRGGSIDLNESYIKVNGNYWFHPYYNSYPKLVGPVSYTIYGNPTIVNGIVSNTDSSNHIRIPGSFSQINEEFEISYKFTTPSTMGILQKLIEFHNTASTLAIETNNKLVFLLNGIDAEEQTANVNIRPSESYYLTANTTYYVIFKKTKTNLYIAVSTDKVNWTTNTKSIPSNIVSFNVSNYIVTGGSNNFSGGTIDLNETYIKVNNTLWFGKENWTPCIFDNNSIVEFVGHKANYNSYNTYAFKPTIQNSSTYDVWIDNQKVFENVTSATQTDINWNNLALTTGYSVTTPEALKAHIVKITPSNKENKFTAFRHVVSSYTSSGTETTGVLQIHFELDYELNLDYLTNQSSSIDTSSGKLQAITSKTNELKITGISAALSSAVQLKRLPKLNLINNPNISQAFQNAQQLKYVDMTSARTGTYTFNSNYLLEKIDGDLTVNESSNNFADVRSLKQLPNITSITTNSLPTYITNASSLQPTNIDLSNKDDLTKLDIYGTSSYRIDGLKSLKVSNEAPFTGTSPQINVSYTGLERNALIELFNSLPTVSNGQTIDITGCTGTSSLTNDDKAIATNKGWTIAGA